MQTMLRKFFVTMGLLLLCATGVYAQQGGTVYSENATVIFQNETSGRIFPAWITLEPGDKVITTVSGRISTPIFEERVIMRRDCSYRERYRDRFDVEQLVFPRNFNIRDLELRFYIGKDTHLIGDIVSLSETEVTTEFIFTEAMHATSDENPYPEGYYIGILIPSLRKTGNVLLEKGGSSPADRKTEYIETGILNYDDYRKCSRQEQGAIRIIGPAMHSTNSNTSYRITCRIKV